MDSPVLGVTDFWLAALLVCGNGYHLAEESIYFAHFNDANLLKNCAEIVGRLHIAHWVICGCFEIDEVGFILIQVYEGVGDLNFGGRRLS